MICFKNLIFILASVCGGLAYADQKVPSYDWEGYWGACEPNEKGLKPWGFFADRLENWDQEQCVIGSIERAKNSKGYDVLNLNCVNKENEPYKQVLRLRINNTGDLLVIWPGGAGFKLPKCNKN